MVSVDVSDHIATISFSNPPHHALPGSILADLASAITQTGEREDVHVIVLRSEGDRTFCAGASFDELVGISDLEQGKRFFMGFAKVINACRKCPKLIIGRVQGKAVGGGVGLAASVDYCLATQYASVKLSELALGIGPFVVGPAVERKIGISAMSQMAIDATEWQTANWAKEKGLYAEVFESTQDLDTGVAVLAQKLAASSPAAMAELKRIFWEDCGHWDSLLEDRAAISGRLVLSEFTRNAIAEFKNRKQK